MNEIQQWKDNHSVEWVLATMGIQVPDGNQVMLRCPFHADKGASFSLNKSKQLWKCHAGCGQGDSITLLQKDTGRSIRDIVGSEEFAEVGTVPHREAKPKAPDKPKARGGKVVEEYVYDDAAGNILFKVQRLEPKSFRQHRYIDGDYKPGMDGVQRVPWRLSRWAHSRGEIWIVEGEKDVLTLEGLGFTATTNPGGAQGWLDAYGSYFKGRDVILCCDQDKAGAEHQEAVYQSMKERAKSVRVVKLPRGNKDVSDFVTAGASKENLQQLADDATPHYQGVALPVFSMADLEEPYARFVDNLQGNSFHLKEWLPAFSELRPIVPGELCMFLGATGIGKTALLSSIAMAAKGLPTLMFQLELPRELVYERMVAAKLRMSCRQVEENYTDATDRVGREVLEKNFKDLVVCCESGLGLKRIRDIIDMSELKLGKRPRLVLIDYVQLIQGGGADRRSRFSDIAEGLKVLAKETGTIIVIASQVARPKDKTDPEIGIHDAKETGSLENSCGLVIGAWRDEGDKELMHLRVLKATKGGGGLNVRANYDAPRMIITQRKHQF